MTRTKHLFSAEGTVVVGALVMLGTLFGLIALIYGLVLRFDPEARRTPGQGDER